LPKAQNVAFCEDISLDTFRPLHNRPKSIIPIIHFTFQIDMLRRKD